MFFGVGGGALPAPFPPRPPLLIVRKRAVTRNVLSNKLTVHNRNHPIHVYISQYAGSYCILQRNNTKIVIAFIKHIPVHCTAYSDSIVVSLRNLRGNRPIGKMLGNVSTLRYLSVHILNAHTPLKYPSLIQSEIKSGNLFNRRPSDLHLDRGPCFPRFPSVRRENFDAWAWQ